MSLVHLCTVLIWMSPILLLLVVNGQKVYLNPTGEAIVLTLGDTVNISCLIEEASEAYDSSGDGPMTTLSGMLYIVFEVEGRTVQNSTRDTITVSYTDRSSVTQGGMYICTVDTGIDIISSNTSTMVAFSPIITDHPVDDILATDGDRVQFNCSAVGFPRPRIEWLKLLVEGTSLTSITTIEGVREVTRGIPTHSTVNNTNTTDEYTVISSLIIPVIEYMGFGNYVCLAILDYTELSPSKQNTSASFALSTASTLTVSPEGGVMVDPQTVNSFNGSSVTLNCTAEGGPDNTFQWTHLRTGEVTVSTSYQYTFTSTVYTGGEYECTVTNEAGEGTGNVTVNVGPVIITSPQNGSMLDIVKLTCTVAGIPVPSITWFHSGTVINEGGVAGVFDNGLTIHLHDDLYGIVTSHLDVSNASHTGYYYCIATSPVDVYDPVMSEMAHISHKVSPSVPERPPIVNPSEAVPEDARTPTSVLLTWQPLDYTSIDDLQYNVTISVNNKRKRRSLAPNSLEACLEAAGITSVFYILVPGNQTNLTVGVAPNISYSFTVAGVTNAGSGPASDAVGFSSPEGVPTAPRFVTLTNTSSTSLELKWSEPICDNGMRTGYWITYKAVEDSDTDELGSDDEPSLLTSVGVSATGYTFTGLTPNSTYEVVICAVSRAGCGVNVTRYQTTNEDDSSSSLRILLVSVLVPVLIILVIVLIVMIVIVVLVFLTAAVRNKKLRKSTNPLDVPDDSQDGLPDNIELEDHKQPSANNDEVEDRNNEQSTAASIRTHNTSQSSII